MGASDPPMPRVSSQRSTRQSSERRKAAAAVKNKRPGPSRRTVPLGKSFQKALGLEAKPGKFRNTINQFRDIGSAYFDLSKPFFTQTDSFMKYRGKLSDMYSIFKDPYQGPQCLGLLELYIMKWVNRNAKKNSIAAGKDSKVTKESVILGSLDVDQGITTENDFDHDALFSIGSIAPSSSFTAADACTPADPVMEFLVNCVPDMTHLHPSFLAAGIRTKSQLAGIATWSDENLLRFLRQSNIEATVNKGSSKFITSNLLEAEALRQHFHKYFV